MRSPRYSILERPQPRVYIITPYHAITLTQLSLFTLYTFLLSIVLHHPNSPETAPDKLV